MSNHARFSNSGFTLCLAAALGLAACAGAGDDAIVTDFGDAVAVSDVDDRGDVDTVLLAADDDRVLGQLHWAASTGTVDLAIGARAVAFGGAMALADAELADVNELVYSIYEIDSRPGAPSSCVGNQLATCCVADAAWSCQARSGF